MSLLASNLFPTGESKTNEEIFNADKNQLSPNQEAIFDEIIRSSPIDDNFKYMEIDELTKYYNENSNFFVSIIKSDPFLIAGSPIYRTKVATYLGEKFYKREVSIYEIQNILFLLEKGLIDVIGITSSAYRKAQKRRAKGSSTNPTNSPINSQTTLSPINSPSPINSQINSPYSSASSPTINSQTNSPYSSASSPTINSRSRPYSFGSSTPKKGIGAMFNQLNEVKRTRMRKGNVTKGGKRKTIRRKNKKNY